MPTLFISIPTIVLLTYLVQNLSLAADEMMTLLEFFLDTVFTYDGKIYQQVKGTPMGSPISGVITVA